MMIDKKGRLNAIHYGERIFYDATRGIAGTTYPIGTPGMPSNTIADAITMLAARNLKALDIHGAVTIAVDLNHKDFFGNYHESVADIVTLAAGNDVDDSHFEGLIVTGAQGGAGLATYKECLLFNMTGFRGLAENCAIYGTLAVATGNADYADFDHCTSVHGQITVTIASPDRVSFKNFSGGMILTAQAAGAVFVRGISGYLEVDAMVGGTLDIYANAADIQINADCTAGIINIYGNARVSGVGGGVAINDYSQKTQVDGKPNVQELIIYPVAEDGGVIELADDGTGPPYYPVAPHSTNANAEGTPGVAWVEDIDFEQEGTIDIISIYAEFEWQTEFVVGAGAGTNSISKIQISRDGGANWVDLTDNFINPNAAMTARIRAGVGLWIPTIVGGANQLQFRLVHWTDDGGGVSTSEAQIRSNSYVRITYRKS